MLTVILIVFLSGAAGVVTLALLSGQGSSATDDHRDPSSLRGAPPGDTPAFAPLFPAGAVTTTVAAEPRIGPPYGSGEGIPAAFRAVEGTYAEVGAVRWWRRALSLVAMTAIVATMGVAVAAVLGGIIGTAAEVLDRAIG